MWNTPTYNTTKLTVELRELIESGVKLWDFEYPSYYKGDQKTAFEQKVIDHFYFRQIGQETTGRFLHQFRTKIREVMPYYVQMYESEALMKGIEDPFGNVDITETFTQTKQETSSGSASGTSESSSSGEGNRTKTGTESGSQKFSDTPQGSIANLDSHLTNATVDQKSLSDTESESSSGSTTSESSSQSSGESSETLSHTFTKKGNQGVNTYAHDMIELRQTFLNIDLMIINELNPLFLGVY